MKIRYDIVGGHKRADKGLEQYAATKPQLTMDEAAVEWIALRFGTWIKETMTKAKDTNRTHDITDDEFRFSNVTSDMFDVEFDEKYDGLTWLRLLGGRELKEDNG